MAIKTIGGKTSTKCGGGVSSKGVSAKGKGVPKAGVGARIPNTQTAKGGARKGPTHGKRTWGSPDTSGFGTGKLPGHKAW